MISWFKSYKSSSSINNGLVQFSYLGTRAKIAFADESGSSDFQQFVRDNDTMKKFDITIRNVSPHVNFIVRNLPPDMERDDWDRFQSIFNCEKITTFKDKNNRPSNAALLSARIDTKKFPMQQKTNI
ncbi:hypothetical protein GJ496_001255 [Pomphorhynchus laevis]|nr:hypothetical protein GJ496_001255 [Pomphorhynchus laevis]